MQENEKTKNERKWCTVLSNTGVAFPKTGKPANKVIRKNSFWKVG
jgi:hypothetical protein